jgi:hypothetical protein
MLTSVILVTLSLVTATGPDTVVVCSPTFVEALAPWIAHRTAQGHELAFVPCTLSAEEIRSAIRQQAKTSPVKFVVLVGDAEPAGAWEPSVRARCVPAFMAEAKVNIRWKSPPELATDNWYADLDDDGVPELAIGRLPADSPADLAVMVSKIIAYESVPVSGTWCQRINFVAGVGNLGPLVDPIVEMAARKFLTDGIPSAYETTMTYANWRSPFCPNPPQFQDAALARFNDGCLFWVYIGHGYPYQLDRMRVPGGSFPVFGTGDVRRLDNRLGMPIAIFLACYTGAYDQPYDCLAEQTVRAPGGPIAVLAGSRVTMPYAMAVMGSGLMDGYFQQRPATLGEVVLYAKRQMVDESASGTDRKLLDLLAKAISPDPQLLGAERLEHVALFNLFGDPLLQLKHGRPLAVAVPEKVMAGTMLEIRGDSPVRGRGYVAVVCRRDRLRDDPPPRQRYDRTVAQNEYNATYAESNDRAWTRREFVVEKGRFATVVKIPPEARGSGHVCVFVTDADGREFAIGAADVTIAAPRVAALPAAASLSDRPTQSGPAQSGPAQSGRPTREP